MGSRHQDVVGPRGAFESCLQRDPGIGGIPEWSQSRTESPLCCHGAHSLMGISVEVRMNVVCVCVCARTCMHVCMSIIEGEMEWV